jgi:hypothetical protein
MKKHEDLAGNAITQGDYVVYAALWSRSATLKYGRVTKLVTEAKDWDGKKKPVTKVQVVSVDRTFKDDWELQGGGWNDKDDPEKCKLQTLGFLDRMLVVTKTQVPEAARALLDVAYKLKVKSDGEA